MVDQFVPVVHQDIHFGVLDCSLGSKLPLDVDHQVIGPFCFCSDLMAHVVDHQEASNQLLGQHVLVCHAGEHHVEVPDVVEFHGFNACTSLDLVSPLELNQYRDEHYLTLGRNRFHL